MVGSVHRHRARRRHALRRTERRRDHEHAPPGRRRDQPGRHGDDRQQRAPRRDVCGDHRGPEGFAGGRHHPGPHGIRLRADRAPDSSSTPMAGSSPTATSSTAPSQIRSVLADSRDVHRHGVRDRHAHRPRDREDRRQRAADRTARLERATCSRGSWRSPSAIRSARSRTRSPPASSPGSGARSPPATPATRARRSS